MTTAGDVCLSNGKQRITNRHLVLAISKDQEIQVLLRKFVISQGGVPPQAFPKKNILIKKDTPSDEVT